MCPLLQFSLTTTPSPNSLRTTCSQNLREMAAVRSNLTHDNSSEPCLLRRPFSIRGFQIWCRGWRGCRALLRAHVVAWQAGTVDHGRTFRASGFWSAVSRSQSVETTGRRGNSGKRERRHGKNAALAKVPVSFFYRISLMIRRS